MPALTSSNNCCGMSLFHPFGEFFLFMAANSWSSSFCSGTSCSTPASFGIPEKSHKSRSKPHRLLLISFWKSNCFALCNICFLCEEQLYHHPPPASPTRIKVSRKASGMHVRSLRSLLSGSIFRICLLFFCSLIIFTSGINDASSLLRLWSFGSSGVAS